jgi:hypothetical protein
MRRPSIVPPLVIPPRTTITQPALHAPPPPPAANPTHIAPAAAARPVLRPILRRRELPSTITVDTSANHQRGTPATINSAPRASTSFLPPIRPTRRRRPTPGPTMVGRAATMFVETIARWDLMSSAATRAAPR